MNYKFKTKPYKHQRETFEETKELSEYAIFWEQGTGKTKLMVDTAGFLYQQGLIDAVLVVAPNGVHRNWVVDEIPTHLPDGIYKEVRSHDYQSSKAPTKWHQAACDRVLKHQGFSWIAMSYEGFMTKAGKLFAKKFLTKRKVLYILDESSAIKTPGAKRTKTIVASGKYAPYRRILDGTPVTQGPFDVFTPMRFLDPMFWLARRIGSFAAFKQVFGVWRKGYNAKIEREYDELVGYKNLDRLQVMLKGISSRVLKKDVLDLPPKLYSSRYFEMTPDQWRHYKEIKNEFMTLLQGEFIAAPLAITRLLRFQQITCGYLPSEETEKMHFIGTKNPRLQVLEEILETTPHKAIIWARFIQDIDQIMKLLGKNAVRYDGQVSSAERAEAIARFQGRRPIMENGQRVGWEEVPEEEQVQFFVANPAAAGTGLTLHAAQTVVYYNNSFDLKQRLQSEDRAHRIGQKNAVQYIDIMAQETVDEHIANNLRKKVDIASQVTGDELKDWI